MYTLCTAQQGLYFLAPITLALLSYLFCFGTLFQYSKKLYIFGTNTNKAVFIFRTQCGLIREYSFYFQYFEVASNYKFYTYRHTLVHILLHIPAKTDFSIRIGSIYLYPLAPSMYIRVWISSFNSSQLSITLRF